jgi:hypothetical protein
MSAQQLFYKFRDTLVSWGVVSRPRFYMRRQPAGAVRARMQGRGRRRWMRRISLCRLLGK